MRNSSVLHGDQPDHFWQTFNWSRRAYEISDNPGHKELIAKAVDRYLVNSGKKQLFATNAMMPYGETCWCLYQTESSFTDLLRVEYVGKTLQDALKWVDELNRDRNCPAARQCSAELAPTPKGSIPGFW
jgi:hypothetical protein